MRPPSTNELFAILLARDLRPEDLTVQVGANLPMARAAVTMASLTTHPDTRVVLGIGVVSLAGGRRPPAVHPFLFDPRSIAGEALMFQSTVFDDMSRPDVFFVGGLQVDRRGNLNLFGVPAEQGGWKLRGPGSIALATMSTYCRGYYLIMPRHDPRTFVERVAVISALGDRAERERLRFPGGGPRLLLSPLGVFDFDDEGELRVRSLHEGVTADAVKEATGFTLSIPDDVPTTDPPSEDELRLLRERVDLEGSLAG
jgi:glutaconate CoA-transferase, subunit B